MANDVFEKLRKQRAKECKATDFIEDKNTSEELYKIVDEEEYIKSKKELKSFYVGGDLESSEEETPFLSEIVDTANDINFHKPNKGDKRNNRYLDNTFKKNTIDKYLVEETFKPKVAPKGTEEQRRLENIFMEKFREINQEESECSTDELSENYTYQPSRIEKYENRKRSIDSFTNIKRSYRNPFKEEESDEEEEDRHKRRYLGKNREISMDREIKKISKNITTFVDADSSDIKTEKKITNLLQKAKEIDTAHETKMRLEREKKRTRANEYGDADEEEMSLTNDNELICKPKNSSIDRDTKRIKTEVNNVEIDESETFRIDPIMEEIQNSPSFAKVQMHEEEEEIAAPAKDASYLKTKFDELVISEDGIIYVYILDICKHKNSIVLYGKTQVKTGKLCSISIYIEDLDRYYYFMVNTNKVYKEAGETIDHTHEKFQVHALSDFVEEFKKIREHHRITKAKYKMVTRKNLNLLTNENHLYVKVLYSYNNDPISENFQKGNSYTSFYCCNEDIIENFIIKKNLKLPCWVKVKNMRMNVSCNISYCHYDCVIPDKKCIIIKEKNLSKKTDADQVKENEHTANTNSVNNVSGSTVSEKKKSFCPTSLGDIPLNKMFIKVISMLNEQNAHEIFSIISLVHVADKKYINFFGIVNKKVESMKDYDKSLCQIFSSEREMIEKFTNKLKPLDIDMYIGYNILNFDLELLIHRCNVHNINIDFLSRKKKIRKTEKMRVNKFMGSSSTGSVYNIVQNIKGRLIMDVYVLCKELIKLTNYCMDEIIDTMKKKYQEQNVNTTSGCNAAKAKDRMNINVYKDFVVNNINLLNCSNLHVVDVESILKEYLSVYIRSQIFCINEIEHICNVLQMIEKTRDLTKLSGYLWMRSLLGYQSERIEYFLMHEYNKKKFITPIVKKRVKQEKDAFKGRAPAKYMGGLVLEPLCGYYDTFVLYLDFNSLYPSIIIEYNVCFSTINLKNTLKNEADTAVPTEEEEEEVEAEVEIEDFDKSKMGILPGILKSLVDKRAFIKKMIASEKNKEKKELLTIQSLSIKLISNSIYGCLGNTSNRFYARHMASYITQKGRSLLQHTKFKVEKEFNLKVVYGDTDSIMIDTGIKSNELNNYKEANRLAHVIKNSINRNYKRLELDLECIFNKLLLLKKKKYACAKVVDFASSKFEYEMKGIDFIKRDFSKISKMVGNDILKIIFGNAPKIGANGKTVEHEMNYDLCEKIHEYLRDVYDKIQKDAYDLDFYIITKKLTKNVEEYHEKSSLGHVLVAERMIQGGMNVSVNKEIQFCVCRCSDVCKMLNKPEEKLNSSQCCYTVEEMRKFDLHIDKDYYIKNQILAPINRLCQYIEGTSAEKIASCFNIFDVREIKMDEGNEENFQEMNVLSLLNESEERFKEIHLKGFIICSKCSNQISPEIFIKYFRCNQCMAFVPIEKIRNYIFVYLHNLFATFHKQISLCNSCSIKTRRVQLKEPNSCPNGNCENKKHALKPMISKNYVYLMLEYFLFLLKDNLRKIPDHQKKKEGDSGEEKKDTKTSETKKEEGMFEENPMVFVCIDDEFNSFYVETPPKKEKFKIDSYENICKTKNLKLNITKGLRMKFPRISNFILFLHMKTNNIFQINLNNERNIIRQKLDYILQRNVYSQVHFDKVFYMFKIPSYTKK